MVQGPWRNNYTSKMAKEGRIKQREGNWSKDKDFFKQQIAKHKCSRLEENFSHIHHLLCTSISNASSVWEAMIL